MGKSVHNDVLDSAHNKTATSILMVACTAEPTTYAEATSTFALADVTVSGGDFSISDGDVSGRKLTIAQKSGVPIDTTGNATHVALCDGSSVLYVTTCASQALTAGNTMTFGTWKIEILDPS